MNSEQENIVSTAREQEVVLHPQKSVIQYDDFARLDIRMGKILEAAPVDGTDKLLKCTIDFGELGLRTIVSGIREFRAPESLVGKMVPYIVNLAPKMIRGVESQGMLLAMSVGTDALALLHPDCDVPPGTMIR